MAATIRGKASSQKTYDAVMEKFDKLAADAGLTTEA